MWRKVLNIPNASMKECTSVLRVKDRDSLFSTLPLKYHTRKCVMGIRAFNAEIATIKDTIGKNPITGKIRIQWWRSQLDGIYQNSDDLAPHPILPMLEHAISSNGLSHRWFRDMLDARDVDMESTPWQSLEEWEEYAEKTQSSMLYLTLECLEVVHDQVDTAASHMGIFIGLMILLKSTPYHMAQGSVHLPRNILDQFNVSESDLYTSSKNTSEVSENVKLAMQHIATHAKAHLEAARSLSVPSSARAAFLVSVPQVLYMSQLERHGFNVFHPNLLSPTAFDVYLAVLGNRLWRKF